MELNGKVALVTGAGRGIGRGIALALAEEGADIAVNETDTLANAFNQFRTAQVNGFVEAEKVAGDARDLGRRAIAVRGDVSRWVDAQTIVQQTIKELGGIDILVNNAGVVHCSPVETMEEEAWDLLMDVNVKGIFLTCKAVIPHMKARRGGKIINIASIAGKNGFGTLAHYCASKFAVVGFTNSLAKELARERITVNAICPGIVWTQMWQYLAQEWAREGEAIEESWRRHLDTIIPQGREQTPADMGALAVFFATADNVTGQAVNVDGGTELH